jgi:hypothetical protein
MRTHAFTWLLLGLLVAGVWANLLRAGPAAAVAQPAGAARTLTLDEITVKRINVVEDSGKPRIVIANADRLPLPVLKGRQWPRSVKLAGMVLYRADGDECGGIGLVDLEGIRKHMMIFDYANSEAIGFGVTEVGDDQYGAGISVLDRLPLDSDILQVGTTGIERIAISNDSGVASVVIKDPKGRPRIRLSVDDVGAARIEVLDEDGKAVYAAPQT